MPIFRRTGDKLATIGEKRIDLEVEVQRLTEANLESVFGLQFIVSELSLNNLRIDTLAWDPESKAFVIIEYKRDKSFSVIDQGYAYLALLLNNKADFILEYNERMNDHLRRDDVDWSQTRVIFVARSFTEHQRQAINFKDLPMELWEATFYEHDLVLFNQIKARNTAESINTISTDETVEQVSREVKTYTVEDQFRPGWEDSRKLYDELSERVLNQYPDLIESPRKQYIGFKIGTQNVFAIEVLKKQLRLIINRHEPKDLNDPEGHVYYRENSFKYFNQHMSVYDIRTAEDIDYGMMLVKQVYRDFVEDDK